MAIELVTDYTAEANLLDTLATTGTFGGSAGEILLAGHFINTDLAGSSIAWTGGTPANATDWTLVASVDNPASDRGAMALYAAICSGTVTPTGVTGTIAGTSLKQQIKVRKYSGSKVDGTVAQGFGDTTTGTGTAAPALSLTVTATGSLLGFVYCDWQSMASPTAISGDTVRWADDTGGTETRQDTNAWIEQTALSSATGATDVGASAPDTGLIWSGVAFELLTSGGGSPGVGSATAPGYYA